jgi:hypothetical protein
MTLSHEERERIAQQYEVIVPEDVEIAQVPRGVSGIKLNISRREAVRRASAVYKRVGKFRRAKEKREKLQ